MCIFKTSEELNIKQLIIDIVIELGKTRSLSPIELEFLWRASRY